MNNNSMWAWVAVLLLVLSAASAQQSHPLSEITADSPFDLQTHKLHDLGGALNLTGSDSMVHFSANQDGDGFGIEFDGSGDYLYFTERYGARGNLLRFTRDPGGGNSLAVDTDLLYVDGANNRVGVGTSTPTHPLHVSGGDVRMETGYGIYFAGSETYTSFIESNSNRLTIRAAATDGVAEFRSYGLNLPQTGKDYNLVAAGSAKLGNSQDAELAIGSGALIRSSGDSYLNGGNVGVGTSTPTSKLDVQGELKSVVGNLNYYMVPQGAIVMWHGAIADIPSGWALCDGTQGTPNMTDRFLRGAGTGEDPGETGGNNTLVLTNNELPSHTHSGTTETAGSHDHDDDASVGPAGDHTHDGSTKSAGSHSHPETTTSQHCHSHDLYVKEGSGSTDCLAPTQVEDDPVVATQRSESKGWHVHTQGTTGTDGAHSHSIPESRVVNHFGHTHGITATSTNGTHTHDSFSTDNTGQGGEFDKRPRYYKLAFIMKL